MQQPNLAACRNDYDIGGESVFSRADASLTMTYAQAAARATELGGKYDGHGDSGGRQPDDPRIRGRYCRHRAVGVAKDNYDINGTPPALAAGFMVIELDTETGQFEILEYNGVIDCGTVIHPLGLANQVKGGAVMGIGLASTERIVYDPQNGLPANVGFHQAKPPSMLDVPSEMGWDAVNKADPENPVGVRGMGEPVMGCAAAALICAISDAMGGHYLNRTPIVPDMIINAMAGREQSHKPLQVYTF